MGYGPWDIVHYQYVGTYVSMMINGLTVHADAAVYAAHMPRSKIRRWVTLDHRGRIAVGTFARHDLYLLNVDEQGIITLTPAEMVPVTPAPIVRKPRKRSTRPATQTAPEQGDE